MNEAETLAQMAADDTAQADTTTRLTAPDALHNAATWYAHNGLPCFPLRPGEKRPATEHGLHDATTNPDQITAWWARWPQANIGLRTGLRFDVIDIDGPQGYASLTTLREQGHLPEILARVVTPRGLHLYVPATGRGNAAGTLPGIDYRGQGGYVVAPPSRRAEDGARWAWTDINDIVALTRRP